MVDGDREHVVLRAEPDQPRSPRWLRGENEWLPCLLIEQGSQPSFPFGCRHRADVVDGQRHVGGRVDRDAWHAARVRDAPAQHLMPRRGEAERGA
jgi:hypothetical protein